MVSFLTILTLKSTDALKLANKATKESNDAELYAEYAELEDRFTGLEPDDLDPTTVEPNADTDTEAEDADDRHTESRTDLSALRPAGKANRQDDDLPSSGSLAEYREQQADADGHGFPATLSEHRECNRVKRKQPLFADFIGR